MEEERGPGLGFSLCFVCGSRPWGAAPFLLCLFIWLLNVFKCSPVPASFFPYLLTSLQNCRTDLIHYALISLSFVIWTYSMRTPERCTCALWLSVASSASFCARDVHKRCGPERRDSVLLQAHHPAHRMLISALCLRAVTQCCVKCIILRTGCA